MVHWRHRQGVVERMDEKDVVFEALGNAVHAKEKNCSGMLTSLFDGSLKRPEALETHGPRISLLSETKSFYNPVFMRYAMIFPDASVSALALL